MYVARYICPSSPPSVSSPPPHPRLNMSAMEGCLAPDDLRAAALAGFPPPLLTADTPTFTSSPLCSAEHTRRAHINRYDRPSPARRPNPRVYTHAIAMEMENLLLFILRYLNARSSQHLSQPFAEDNPISCRESPALFSRVEISLVNSPP